MNTKFPLQTCVRCHQTVNLRCGKFVWSRHKFNRKLFICDECLDKSKTKALNKFKVLTRVVDGKVVKVS
jgi:uncharacterized CHY-type Zn-finger protein